MSARTLKPREPRPLASVILDLNDQLVEGDESQAVELPGRAWAELVDAAAASEEPELSIREAGDASIIVAPGGDLFISLPRGCVRMPLEVARNLATRLVGFSERAEAARANRSQCCRHCDSPNTGHTDDGICQACGVYDATKDRRAVPPPKKKRAKKVKVGPCPHCGDHDHGAEQCGTAPSDDPPVPEQVELDEAIGGAS